MVKILQLQGRWEWIVYASVPAPAWAQQQYGGEVSRNLALTSGTHGQCKQSLSNTGRAATERGWCTENTALTGRCDQREWHFSA